MITIKEDDLCGREIINLLEESLEEIRSATPAGSSHALDLSGLKSSDITFWTAWEGEELVGCGALKHLSNKEGEIKSMRAVTSHRGKGIGMAILSHIVQEAEERAYTKLYLETAVMDYFLPACNNF